MINDQKWIFSTREQVYFILPILLTIERFIKCFLFELE